jgi:hypothetical protein
LHNVVDLVLEPGSIERERSNTVGLEVVVDLKVTPAMVYGVRTPVMVVIVGLPIAITPWGSDLFLGRWLTTVNFGSRTSYSHLQRGPTTQKHGKTLSIRAWEIDLVLLTKSVEINFNILPIDLYRSKLNSKIKLNINSSIN